MNKLFVFDLDGTLLNSKGIITKESKDVICKCKNNGNYVAYITGRGNLRTKEFLKGLPCDGYACNNGSKIYCDNKLIDDYCIEYEYAKEFLENECKNKDFICAIEPYKYFSFEDPKIDNKNYFKSDINRLPELPIDMITVRKAEKIDVEKYKNIQIRKTRNNELLITAKKATKLNSLKIIANYFKIKKENIIVFGDDFSDIEMFKNCGYSIAMGNAVKEVKDIATYVTQDNDNNGIASFINKFFRDI